MIIVKTHHFISYCLVLACLLSRAVDGENEPLSSVSSFIDVSNGKIYSMGLYPVTLTSVPSNKLENEETVKGKPTSSVNLPPLPMLVAAPSTAGTFPVVQFQHGFSLQNMYYQQLLSQIASHGFIVVAPQMYSMTTGVNATNEISDALTILSWLSTGLTPVLSQTTLPDFKRIAFAGHSRGGKVAFGAALKNNAKPVANISALIGVDPVDGSSNSKQSPPPILTYQPHSFNLPYPTLVIGSGLGPVSKFPFPACVPKDVGHADFYIDSSAPAYHFVAQDYGHMDVLDDSPGGVAELVAFACSRGPNREDMRRWTGGVIIAFLKSALLNDSADFGDLVDSKIPPPITLNPPESYVTAAQEAKKPVQRDMGILYA